MRRYCLDTNVVISVLSNNAGGHRTAEEWEGIREITHDIDRRHAQLVLPTLIFAELLPSHHGNAIAKIEAFFNRRSVELRELTVKIARRAAELRDVAKLGSGKALKTADSVFLATAELADVDTLYSADPDIYKAVSTGVQVARPYSRRMSLLPPDQAEPPWTVS